MKVGDDITGQWNQSISPEIVEDKESSIDKKEASYE